MVRTILRADLVRAGVVAGFEARSRCGWRAPLTHRGGDPPPERGDCPECGRRYRVAGLPPPLRGHDLRHTFATLATEAGVAPDVVRMTLGHAGGVTASYQHLSLEAHRRELSRLSIVPLAQKETPDSWQAIGGQSINI